MVEALCVDEAEANKAPSFKALLEGRENALLRPLSGIIAGEMARQRGRPVPIEELRNWGTDTSVDEDGLGVDSLARLEVVTAVNRAFQLSKTGVEDYLLVHRTLGEWCTLIAEGFRQLADNEPEEMAFQTSGSTDAPKVIVHDVADLIEEAMGVAALLPGTQRVVALVPSHHIYGFIWTVLVPLLHGWPVADLSHSAPGALSRQARTGDVAVATPFVWDLIARAAAPLHSGVDGITSAAPAPEGLWGTLRAAGLGQLTEIYGSTETLGVGFRTDPQAHFDLLAHLEPVAGADHVLATSRHSGRQICPPDSFQRRGPRGFALLGRLDQAVQVGGINVFPDKVREVLAAAPGIAEVAVRLDSTGAAARLKAFIVPTSGTTTEDPAGLEALLRQHAAANLSDPERPASYRFGASMLRDRMGKLTDW